MKKLILAFSISHALRDQSIIDKKHFLSKQRFQFCTQCVQNYHGHIKVEKDKAREFYLDGRSLYYEK